MDLIPEMTSVADSAMTQDEKQFFRQLGGHIAALRKEQSLTQAQLAELLGLTQQMVASYEVGRRRVPVSLLPLIATTLAVTVENLIGHNGTAR
jgi:transcriptional regulator with XRE-family HTH domain